MNSTVTKTEPHTDRRPLVNPAVDIYESPDAFHLACDLPGVAEADLDVQIERNLLTIHARSSWKSESGKQVLLSEFTPVDYERSFTLSDTIDQSGVKASFQCGVLCLLLPKARQARPQRIAISTK